MKTAETMCPCSRSSLQTALRMSRLKGLAPSGGEEARPTGDHPDRHTEPEAAVRCGPRFEAAAASGNSMYGVLAAVRSLPNGSNNEPPEESGALGRRRSPAHR